MTHLVNNSVGNGVAHGGGPGATGSPADGPGGGVTERLCNGDALGHPSAERERDKIFSFSKSNEGKGQILH